MKPLPGGEAEVDACAVPDDWPCSSLWRDQAAKPMVIGCEAIEIKPKQQQQQQARTTSPNNNSEVAMKSGKKQ
jgi:hypothetical protein